MDINKVIFDELRCKWGQEFDKALAILTRENIENIIHKHPLSQQEKALSFLYGEQRKAKIALGRAEGKPNVQREEIESLQNKIDAIDWILGTFFEGEKQCD